MGNRTKFSHSIQAAQAFSGRRTFHKFLGIVALFVVVLLASACAAALPAPENEANVQRAFEQNAARYDAMTAYYTAEIEANQKRIQEAEAARYGGLALFHNAETEARDSANLASNPELSAARRYAAAGGNASNQPGTFDRAALRQTFFNDWKIEADAVDVGLIEPGPEGNVTAEQVTFDVGTVRAHYAKEWVAEADAVDVSLIEPPLAADPASEQETPDFWIEVLGRNYEGQQAVTAGVASKPATFDIEALRETFFNDWVIEADAVDVNTLVQPIEGNVTDQAGTFDTEALRQTFFNDWKIEAEATDVSVIGQSSSFSAANPELSVAQRYPVADEMTGSELLAANPELSIAHRYAGIVKWNKIHFPGR